MNTYATREEAIQANIIGPMEADGVRYVRISWDVEAIADEVLSGPEEGYAVKVSDADLQFIIANNERLSYGDQKAWYGENVRYGWFTLYKNQLFVYTIEEAGAVTKVEEIHCVKDRRSGNRSYWPTGNVQEFESVASAEDYIVSKITR